MCKAFDEVTSPIGTIFSEGAIYKYWYNFISFVNRAFL